MRPPSESPERGGTDSVDATTCTIASASVDGRELEQPRAVREALQQLRGHLHREPRLADAAHTGDRDDAGLVERLAQLDELVARDPRTT